MAGWEPAIRAEWQIRAIDDQMFVDHTLTDALSPFAMALDDEDVDLTGRDDGFTVGPEK